MVADQANVGSARERILEAAERVITEVGAAHLTLDAVAQAAGVSKGGLLYHFPSKESLLVAHDADGFQQRHGVEIEDRLCARLVARLHPVTRQA